MSSPLTKKCRGLYTATNRYDVPEGALVTATNILISKDGVIQPRWGLVPSATSVSLGAVNTWHRAIEFGGNIWLAGYNSVAGSYTIGYCAIPFAGVTAINSDAAPPDGVSAYVASTTPFFDVEFLRANQNLYYNLSSGLARSAGTTANESHPAGGYPCAVSCFPRPLSVNSATRAANVTTVNTAFAHGYVVGINVTTTGYGTNFTVATVPSTTSFTIADAGANGAVAITAVTATNLVGTNGFMAVNDRVAYRAHFTEFDTAGNSYEGEVSDRIVVTNAAPFVGTAAAKNVQLAVLFTASGPSANTKLEVYRSHNSPSKEPSDNMYLVYTKYLTEDERNRGYVWITDIAPDSVLGKSLYLNEDQDGLKQNANRPAACKTVAQWGRRTVMANTFDMPSIEMQLLSTDTTSGGLVAGDEITLDYNNNYFLTAVASGTAYTTARKFTTFNTGGATSTTDIKHTVLSMLDSLNWGGGTASLSIVSTYLGRYISVGNDLPGRFAIALVSPDQYENTSANYTSRAVSAKTGGTSTRGCFAPILNELKGITDATRTANVMVITTTANHNFVVGESVILYSSWPNQTQASIGGSAVEGVITSVTAGTITFSNTGSNGTLSSGVVTLKYRPTFNNGRARNRVRVSKVSPIGGYNPEGFPTLENFIDVGDRGKHVLKCVPCKDSLLVFKEDGLFRVTASGVYGEKLYAEVLDPTAVLWAKDSAVSIQGKVMAWLTKGVAIINEQGVEKYVSERIQDRLRPATTGISEPDILSYPFSRRAQAFVDEVNGLYELRVCMTSGPSAPYASTINVIYDMLNDTWVEDDLAVVSEAFYQNKRYIIQGTSFYAQSDQVYAGQPTGVVTSGSFTATSTADVYGFTYTGALTAGCTIYGSGSLLTVIYVLSASGGVGTAYSPFYSAATLNFEGAWSSYSPVISTVQWAPITAGEENTLKRFMESQIMMGLRTNLVAEVSYSTELVSTAETLTCKLGTPVLFGAGVGGYAPYNLRTLVPQQHRVGQQLNVKLVIRAAYGAWTVLGLGVSMKSVSTRVNR